MLRERHLGGTIILADAHIRDSKPISTNPHAGATRASASISTVSARRTKVRCRCKLIFGDETPGAVFEGTYIVLPA